MNADLSLLYGILRIHCDRDYGHHGGYEGRLALLQVLFKYTGAQALQFDCAMCYIVYRTIRIIEKRQRHHYLGAETSVEEPDSNNS